MINTKTGAITVNEKLVITREFTFNDFTKHSYFKNQNEEREIQLGGIGSALGYSVYVSIFFKNSLISKVMLMFDSPQIRSFEDEPKRKAIHEKYLKSIGLESVNEFEWGTVKSDFDKKSTSSDIIISYKV